VKHISQATILDASKHSTRTTLSAQRSTLKALLASLYSERSTCSALLWTLYPREFFRQSWNILTWRECSQHAICLKRTARRKFASNGSYLRGIFATLLAWTHLKGQIAPLDIPTDRDALDTRVDKRLHERRSERHQAVRRPPGSWRQPSPTRLPDLHPSPGWNRQAGPWEMGGTRAVGPCSSLGGEADQLSVKRPKDVKRCSKNSLIVFDVQQNTTYRRRLCRLHCD